MQFYLTFIMEGIETALSCQGVGILKVRKRGPNLSFTLLPIHSLFHLADYAVKHSTGPDPFFKSESCCCRLV